MSNPALRLAKTVTMYIWDLETKKKLEIKHIILVDVGILFFMQANCQMSEVDSIRRFYEDFLGIAFTRD